MTSTDYPCFSRFDKNAIDGIINGSADHSEVEEEDSDVAGIMTLPDVLIRSLSIDSLVISTEGKYSVPYFPDRTM